MDFIKFLFTAVIIPLVSTDMIIFNFESILKMLKGTTGTKNETGHRNKGYPESSASNILQISPSFISPSASFFESKPILKIFSTVDESYQIVNTSSLIESTLSTTYLEKSKGDSKKLRTTQPLSKISIQTINLSQTSNVKYSRIARTIRLAQKLSTIPKVSTQVLNTKNFSKSILATLTKKKVLQTFVSSHSISSRMGAIPSKQVVRLLDKKVTDTSVRGVYETSCMSLQGRLSIEIGDQNATDKRKGSRDILIGIDDQITRRIVVPLLAESVNGNCTDKSSLNSSIIIKWGGGLYSMSLFFTKNSSHWYLSSIKLKIDFNNTSIGSKKFSTYGQWFTAPRNYSFHCAKKTAIRLNDSGVVVVLEDVHVEPEKPYRKAYSAKSISCTANDVIQTRRKLVPILIIAMLPVLVLIGIVGLACVLKHEKRSESFIDELDEELTVSDWTISE